MQRAHAEKGLNCPLYKQDVSEVCHNCTFWAFIRGADPQTNEPINEWRCAINMLPGLLINIGREVNHTGSEVHELRNDTTQRSEEAHKALFGQQIEMKLIQNAVSHTNANRME